MTRKAKPKINKPPVLFQQSQRLVAQLEKQLDATFISYWHGPGGEVCNNDVLVFFSLLKKIGTQKRIMLFVKSDGGVGKASLRIVNLLRQYTSRLSVLIPLNCMSAATMIALGADEILMGPMAHLSPVDTSLTHDLSPIDVNNNRVSVSLDELTRILNLWQREAKEENVNPYSAIFNHVHPLVIGAVDRSSSLSIRICREILSSHMTDLKKAEAISRSLNADFPSHSYPIMLKEAQRLGLNAQPMSEELNSLLLDLNEVYSEMGQRALTDYDEFNYHDNEIFNIAEVRGLQIFYQTDKDWHYRAEERRWVPMNDNSAWQRIERNGSKTSHTVFHIR
jgi:hypothetical protein